MNYRSYFLSFASLAVIACAMPSAKAQVLSPTSSSSATSSSGATSGSTSGATAIGLGGGGGTSSAGATGTGGQSGASSGVTFNSGNGSPSTSNVYNPSDVTVRSAPQVYVPSVVTGNVCALGASAGASFIGTGFAVGGSWESEQCERRQTAALLYNAGYKDASRELMCDKREVYDSMKRAGTPCLVRPDWEPKQTMAQQPAPVSIITPAPVVYAAPPPPKTYPRCNARLGILENCIS
jgi:hypothetical protein